MNDVRLNSVDFSERTAPAALSTAPTPGNMMVPQRSRRAIDTVDASGSAPADDDGIGGIDTLLDGNVLDGIDHALGREIEDRKRGLLSRHPEGTCHLVGNGASRRVGDETHTAAEKEVRIDIAEHDGSIRHRRLLTASAIAYRPRRGAGALGAHAQQSHRVDAGDTATTGAYALDVDRRKTREMSLIDRTKPGVAGPRDHSRAYQAYVERCAAGIGDNRRIRVLKLRKVPAGNRRHRRAGVQRQDRPIRQFAEFDQSALRSDRMNLPAQPARHQIFAQRTQIVAHDRLQRRIDAAGRCPPILAHGRIDAMAERIRHFRKMTIEQRCHLQLVRRIDDRPQERDGNSLDLRGLQSFNHPQRCRFVKGLVDAAVGAHAFRNLEGECS
jgi:hypothetical protein